MNVKQALKTLLIVILVEQIKSAKEIRRFIPEDSNGYSDTTKESMENTNKL